jgi:hypothetical protein
MQYRACVQSARKGNVFGLILTVALVSFSFLPAYAAAESQPETFPSRTREYLDRVATQWVRSYASVILGVIFLRMSSGQATAPWSGRTADDVGAPAPAGPVEDANGTLTVHAAPTGTCRFSAADRSGM